jgi:hypothetical protein
MEYEVEREYGQWHIREKGQLTRGTTVTDTWLEQMGFGRLTRLNIDQVVTAAAASAAGYVLDPYAASRRPRDIPFKAGFKSYRPRYMDIPERILRK